MLVEARSSEDESLVGLTMPRLPNFTSLYFTLLWLYFTLLEFTLTWLYFTLLESTLLYHGSIHTT